MDESEGTFSLTSHARKHAPTAPGRARGEDANARGRTDLETEPRGRLTCGPCDWMLDELRKPHAISEEGTARMQMLKKGSPESLGYFCV